MNQEEQNMIVERLMSQLDFEAIQAYAEKTGWYLHFTDKRYPSVENLTQFARTMLTEDMWKFFPGNRCNESCWGFYLKSDIKKDGTGKISFAFKDDKFFEFCEDFENDEDINPFDEKYKTVVVTTATIVL